MKYSSSNEPMKCYMTQSTWFKANTNEMEVKGILWHSTGANNPNISRYVQPDDKTIDKQNFLDIIGTNKYKNDWNHITVSAGVHAFIGKLKDGTITTVNVAPWNKQPWGCGKGSKGSCNDGWIQFEICEDNLNDKTYFDKVYNEACELTAYLCKKYNLDPLGETSYKGIKVPIVLCHADSYKLGLGSNHGDILHWFKNFGKTMEDVRKDVKRLMANDIPSPIQLPSKEFKVKITAAALNYRNGPGTQYKVNGVIMNKGVYTIVDQQGNWGKLKSGAGWISLNYTTRV